MSDARNAILARLRQAERTGRVPEPGGDPIVPPHAPASDDECLGRFLGELAALGVEPHVETTADGVRSRVRGIVGARKVFSWDPEHLPYDVARVLPHAIHGAAPRDALASADIGVTGADGAIAETGSIVLLAGAGRPRAASLLPPVHLAIVSRGDLRFGMADYFRERAAAIAEASSCMIVTGPSRTADIELTLTVGVHGPGTVIVVVGP